LGCRFEPHSAIVGTNQRLLFREKDAVVYEPHWFPSRGSRAPVVPFRELAKSGVAFTKAESTPFLVTCDIHSWMRAWVLVVDHPYATITAADGTFTIKDLPAGEHELRMWHERIGFFSPTPGDRSFTVTVTRDKTTEVRTVTIPFKRLENPNE